MESSSSNDRIVKSFNPNECESEAVFSCHSCYVDIFLETHIFMYIPDGEAYFVKQNTSINFTCGNNRRINCANCGSFLGRIIYRCNAEENELRLTEILPKYDFK